MRQILQSLRTGATELTELPCPQVKPGHLLIRTGRSLLSSGTERMLIEFGKAGWIEKARRQPERVRQVLDKVRTDGLLPTLEAVQSRLEGPMPLGYCNAGVVLEVGAGVEGFAVGDRAASNGPHAEVVCVPKHLCAKVPSAVADEAAAFTVLGAIALQGARLAEPTLGEVCAVVGLGLVGQLTVQFLTAQGCRVLGIEPDAGRRELAERFGAETVGEDTADVLAAADVFSRGRGVDAVLITAATASNEPIHQAAQMCRQRGRIVLVGVVGLELDRSEFYGKELTFQVSCSYGPGRYDPAYEERGQDYPFGLVRWTEQRNLEAVLDLMAGGRLDVAPLVSHRFPFDRAPEAYQLLTERSGSLGIVLEYRDAGPQPEAALRRRTIEVGAKLAASAGAQHDAQPVVLGVIGAGNYGTRTLIPALGKTGARLKTVASSGGVTGAYAARRFGFEQATTDAEALFADPEINAVVIATRHDTHARFVCRALGAGKHVFVEKPLAITEDQLTEIEAAYAASADPPVLAVGFNRRFAPHTERMKALLEGLPPPKGLIMTVNAGAIPADHWTQDPDVGGGRVVGEACHFIDLLRFLVGHPIVTVEAQPLRPAAGLSPLADTVSFTLGFADGSLGTVHYLANGHGAFPKERLEVFCAGHVLQLDNFRRLRGFGWPGFHPLNLWRQDKGHAQCAAKFVAAVRGGPSPIPFGELVEVTRTSLRIAEATRL